MATKQPSGSSGVENYGTPSPRANIGKPQPAVGGGVTTKRIPASATYAGHSQVNPGSTKK